MLFAARFARDFAAGDLPPETDLAALGTPAAASLTSRVLRARTGLLRRVLETLARAAVALLCRDARASDELASPFHQNDAARVPGGPGIA